VFFTDVCGGFMQEIFSAVSDCLGLPSQFPSGLGLAYAGFALVRLGRLTFAGYRFLKFADLALMAAKAVQRFYDLVIG
jgi:hypothetical protein